MRKDEALKYLKSEENRNFMNNLEKKSIQEIDEKTLEIIPYVEELKCEYQWLKGRICEQLKESCDFETMLLTIRDLATASVTENAEADPEVIDDAGWIINEKDNIYDSNFKGNVKGLDIPFITNFEIKSETEEEAIQTINEEFVKLKGMGSILNNYVDYVIAYCVVYLQKVLNKGTITINMPDFLLGDRNENGELMENTCRFYFAEYMLGLMEKYDVKSVHLLNGDCNISDNIQEAEFPEKTINRKALVDLLKNVYFLDYETIERLRSNDGYFVETAKRFLNETEKAMAKPIRDVFFAAYGIEDGISRSLLELSKQFGATREKIRQILAREARKLKHPLRRKSILGE